MNPDLVPFVSTVGGGFLAGALLGYAIKKVIKFIAVIGGLFIAALAYPEYQRVITIDWMKLQAILEQAITTLENTITPISTNVPGAHAPLAATNLALAISSVSAGFTLGLVRG
jgi:uncharacterized membrane protein (Fun14 family)